MADAHTNFAYSTVLVAPSPASSGTSLSVQDGDGRKFPPPPFNATVWPTGAQPTSANAEIVRVIANVDGVFTLSSTPSRNQEGSSSRSIVVGDQIAATITAKTLTDMETPISYWSPYILASSNSATSAASNMAQTLAANYTTVVGTNSLFVFPITVPDNLQVNQILVANSYNFVTQTVASASNSYYSKFGIYTMNANTLSLVGSSSFSIAESINSNSLTWSYPVSTATSGYLYSTLAMQGVNTIGSYVSGTRLIGMQFGSNLTFTGGVYWLGILSLKSTANTRSTYGLSNAGLLGQPIPTVQQVGTVNGPMPIGYAVSASSGTNASHVTQWWGRHIIGFVTATSLADQLGTAVPNAISLSALAGFAAASSGTILPSVTFVST